MIILAGDAQYTHNLILEHQGIVYPLERARVFPIKMDDQLLKLLVHQVFCPCVHTADPFGIAGGNNDPVGVYQVDSGWDDSVQVADNLLRHRFGKRHENSPIT